MYLPTHQKFMKISIFPTVKMAAIMQDGSDAGFE